MPYGMLHMASKKPPESIVVEIEQALRAERRKQRPRLGVVPLSVSCGPSDGLTLPNRPPALKERKTIREPSGENLGFESSARW